MYRAEANKNKGKHMADFFKKAFAYLYVLIMLVVYSDAVQDVRTGRSQDKQQQAVAPYRQGRQLKLIRLLIEVAATAAAARMEAIY